MKKRSKLVIVMDILAFIESEGGETLATRIATATGLAYDRMIRLLEELEKKNIVNIVSGERSKKVVLTEKGVHLLKTLRELRDLIKDLGLEIY
ncbi:MAG: winged helix-turn-helix domain-containing protein [Sulfolobales archaeon]